MLDIHVYMSIQARPPQLNTFNCYEFCGLYIGFVGRMVREKNMADNVLFIGVVLSFHERMSYYQGKLSS